MRCDLKHLQNVLAGNSKIRTNRPFYIEDLNVHIHSIKQRLIFANLICGRDTGTISASTAYSQNPYRKQNLYGFLNKIWQAPRPKCSCYNEETMEHFTLLQASDKVENQRFNHGSATKEQR